MSKFDDLQALGRMLDEGKIDREEYDRLKADLLAEQAAPDKPMQGRPPGWYDDPSGQASHQAYWDGEKWTGQTRSRFQANVADAKVTEPDPRPFYRRGGFVVLAILLLAILPAGVASSLSGDEVEETFTDIAAGLESDSPDPGPTSPPSEWERACPGPDRLVTYFVEGTARGVDLTINNRQGNTEQASGKAVPLTVGDEPGLTIGCVPAGFFYYISAQNTGETGSVRCRVEADGVEVSEASSSGAYVIASCSGSTP